MAARRRDRAGQAWGGVFLGLVGAMAVLAMWAPIGDAPKLYLWELGLMVAALAVVGRALNGRWIGAAIDSRNRVSLSKLQMLSWTVIVVCSLLTVGAYRLHAADVSPIDALVIQLDPQLLFAMGISAASFVATPAVLSLKAAETPTEEAVEATIAARGADVAEHNGKVDRRSTPSGASLTDLFRGDEVGNNLSLDVSKVQQLAISLLLMGIYVGMVYKELGPCPTMQELPKLDDSLVQLMAISHASYLAYKAAPKTSSGTASSETSSGPSGPPGAISSVDAHGS